MSARLSVGHLHSERGARKLLDSREQCGCNLGARSQRNDSDACGRIADQKYARRRLELAQVEPSLVPTALRELEMSPLSD